ncbi:hypothetical protein MMC25_004670 [Agyrium rufum]|nr:hypothetical protein [Agyrium rufum]
MKPSAQILDGTYFLNYKLPYSIKTSCIYPLDSPNGSTIIICGHERGLLILWRGGRPYRTQDRTSKDQPLTNGEKDDALIDLDASMAEEDESTEEIGPAKEEDFDSEEEEFDLKHPYLPIIQRLEIAVDSPVSHVGVPEIPYTLQTPELRRMPRLLQENLILAVGCADGSVKLVTLPLLPPRPKGENGGSLSRVRTISRQEAKMHQGAVQGISVALFSTALQTSIEDSSNSRSSQSSLSWDLLIASHTSGPRSLLMVHKIPMSQDSMKILSDGGSPADWLWRVQSLPKPARSIHLHSSLRSTSPKNSSILITESRAAVRIYQCDPESENGMGSWAPSLHPDLSQNTNGEAISKTIVDAKWIFDGNVIMVLTSDGQWSVLEVSKISSTIPTKFTLTAWVGRSLASTHKVSGSRRSSALAPMTPATRKLRQEKLFAGISTETANCVIGGILSSSAADFGSEVITIWHGDKMTAISNMAACLMKAGKGDKDAMANTLGAQTKDYDLSLSGIPPQSINLFRRPTTSKGLKSAPADILVTGSRSITIIAEPLSGPRDPVEFPTIDTDFDVDQHLLERGELDVFGVDRMLERMNADKHVKNDMLGNILEKHRVSFAAAAI